VPATRVGATERAASLKEFRDREIAIDVPDLADT
jgi:hypothetical protein